MFSLRRYAVYLGLAACILLTLNYFRTDLLAQARARYPSGIPGQRIPDSKAGQDLGSVVDPSTGRFQWKNVPTHYPLKDFTALPTSKPLKLPKVQQDFSAETAEHAAKRKNHQNAVRDTFERSWKAYREHAWMKDELGPLSGGTKNGFGGWGASLVDNLDNLWIMGLKDQFDDAVSAAMDIDLGSATTDTVNVFETTIRHLGGFLACYDVSGDKRCLTKAVEFGEMLYKAFDTPNHMPITRWKPQQAIQEKQTADKTVLVAEIGSLCMEFTRLTMVSGDPKYYDAVDRITRLFAAQQSKTHLPGMWPVVVNARDENFMSDTYYTLGAMSDSLYEYFPKMQALLGGVDPVWEDMYTESMKVALEHTIYRPMVPDDADILVAGAARAYTTQDPKLEPKGEHLACFTGGMYALGGKLFSNPEDVVVGQKLTDGCIWTYRALPLGIMPEVFKMVPCPSKTQCTWNESLWLEEASRHVKPTVSESELAGYLKTTQRLPKGFSEISDRRYILRPEAIESVFILYRITGSEKYLDAAWDMFTAIISVSRTHLANAALSDITWNRKDLAEQQIQMDSMESFWMAETLKYFYLIFSEPDVISLDEYVFNTEAHPFKRALPT